MRRDDVLKSAAVDARQQDRRGLVVEMAEAPSDTLLEPGGIRAAEQHVPVVVALEHQGIDRRQTRFHVRGATSQVGQYTQAVNTVGEYELHRLARIVRHRERKDLHVADAELGVTVDNVQAGRHHLFGEAMQGAEGEPHGEVVAAAQSGYTADVVAMLVGDDNAGKICGCEPEAGKPEYGICDAESAVEEQAGVSDLHDQPIALRAATQGREAHQSPGPLLRTTAREPRSAVTSTGQEVKLESPPRWATCLLFRSSFARPRATRYRCR